MRKLFYISLKKFRKILIFWWKHKKMCFHGNRHPGATKQPFLIQYSKYPSLYFFCLLIINSPLCPSLYCMGWNGSAFCISSILLMQVKIGLQIENLSLFSVSLMIPFILGLHSCPGIVISFCWLSEDCKNYWMTPHLHTLTGIMWTRRPVRLT